MIQKKSQGMPVNVMIIAVLALIVLIVLVAIFTGRTKLFSQDLQSCTSKQGQCDENCGANRAFIANTDCPDIAKKESTKKDKCCIEVFRT